MVVLDRLDTLSENPPKELWVGLLGVEPIKGCEIFDGDDVAGAYVYFVATVQDDNEFRAIATDISERAKLNVHDFDEVMPWSKWRKATEKVDAYLDERAKESEVDGQPRFGEFHCYLDRNETVN